MVNTKGYRRGTRYLFARDFRRRGEYMVVVVFAQSVCVCVYVFNSEL